MKRVLCLVAAVLMALLTLVGCGPKMDTNLAGRWEALGQEGVDFNDKIFVEFWEARDYPGVYDGILKIYVGNRLARKDSEAYYKYTRAGDDSEFEIIAVSGSPFGSEFKIEGNVIYEERNNDPVLKKVENNLSEEEETEIREQLIGFWREEDDERESIIREYFQFNEDGTIQYYLDSEDDVYLGDDGKVYYKDIVRESKAKWFYTIDKEGVTIYRDTALTFEKNPPKANEPEPFNAVGTYQLEGKHLFMKDRVCYEKIE